MSKVTTVGGLERHPTMQSGLLDTSIDLARCPMCGSEVGYRTDTQQPHYLRAECANTSCGVATPFHYKSREDAAYAWNRRPGMPAKRV